MSKTRNPLPTDTEIVDPIDPKDIGLGEPISSQPAQEATPHEPMTADSLGGDLVRPALSRAEFLRKYPPNPSCAVQVHPSAFSTLLEKKSASTVPQPVVGKLV